MNKAIQYPRIAIVGFMGVGKSTVSRRLAGLIDSEWVDLDVEIEAAVGRSLAEFVDDEGIDRFRELEAAALVRALDNKKITIISLGGGAFVSSANRAAIKESEFTSIWLEATFDHCWANIRSSYKDRPLARNRTTARELFEQRIRQYCLADWHFVVQPGCNSIRVAEQIAEEIYGVRV